MTRKKVATKPKQERTKQKVLENFLTMLTALYPKDRLAPGICISRLSNGQWYGTIYQYPNIKRTASEEAITGRVCLYSVREDSFNAMVVALLEPWQKSLDCLK